MTYVLVTCDLDTYAATKGKPKWGRICQLECIPY